MSKLTQSALNEELEVLQEVLAILTKSLLHHNEYIEHGNALIANKQRLYSVLGDIFEKWAEQLQVVERYAVIEEQLSIVIEWCIAILLKDKDSLLFATSLPCTHEHNIKESVTTSINESNVSWLILFINAAPFINVEEATKGLLSTHSEEQIMEITQMCKVIQNKYNNYTEHRETLDGQAQKYNEKGQFYNVDEKVNVIILTSVICSLLPSYNLAFTLSTVSKIMHNVKIHETTNVNTASLLKRLILAAMTYIWSFANNSESNNDNDITNKVCEAINGNVNSYENTLQNIANKFISGCSNDRKECELSVDELHSNNNNINYTSIFANTTEATSRTTTKAPSSFLMLSEEISSLLNTCSPQEQQELSHYYIDTYTNSTPQQNKHLANKKEGEHNDHLTIIVLNDEECNLQEGSHDKVSDVSSTDKADIAQFWQDLTSEAFSVYLTKTL